MTPHTTSPTPRLADLLVDAAEVLRKAGCPGPQQEAEILAADALGIEPTSLSRLADEEISAPVSHAIAARVERRARHEPIGYILGRAVFCGLELLVDRRVLVPASDTELLVEYALELDDGARVHDVGTGSGAIALAIKNERPDLRVSGSDISSAAIEVARSNAARLGLEVTFFVADGVPAGRHDLIVANPPYVDEGDEARILPLDTKEHQPRLAVFAGKDGLAVIRRFLSDAPRGSRVAVEHAPSQAADVRALLSDSETRLDRSGSERFTAGWAT